MSFVRGEQRFLTILFLKSESKVTEGTNLYSASHFRFRAAYKSSGRISKLALSFITEHCLAELCFLIHISPHLIRVNKTFGNSPKFLFLELAE